ncbi:hypothetical protein HZB88_03075 [archaeon]|nr:hypothetical protein [archaeon]
MSGRKGQMFIIMGVIFIVLFAALKTYYLSGSDVKRKEYLENSLEKEKFLVLKQESKKIVAMAYDQNTTLVVQNFFNFVKDKLYGKDLSLEVFFLKANFSTVVSNTNTNMNVSVLNMLGRGISNLNLTFNGSTQFVSSLADNSTYSTNFTFNTSSDINYTLTVSYSTSSSGVSYSITISTMVNKGRVVGFYDLALIGSTTRHQDIFQESYLI